MQLSIMKRKMSHIISATFFIIFFKISIESFVRLFYSTKVLKNKKCIKIN